MKSCPAILIAEIQSRNDLTGSISLTFSWLQSRRGRLLMMCGRRGRWWRPPVLLAGSVLQAGDREPVELGDTGPTSLSPVVSWNKISLVSDIIKRHDMTVT